MPRVERENYERTTSMGTRSLMRDDCGCKSLSYCDVYAPSPSHSFSLAISEHRYRTYIVNSSEAGVSRLYERKATARSLSFLIANIASATKARFAQIGTMLKRFLEAGQACSQLHR
jgi:hypothetical protein